MSFIRCLSNPESLYVYPDVEGFICWTQGPVHEDGLQPQNKVNREDFFKLMRKYINGDDFPLKVGSLSVREAKVYDDSTLDDVKMVYHRSIKAQLEDKRKSSYKILVRNNGVLIGILWKVTWEYLVKNVKKDIEHRREVFIQKLREADALEKQAKATKKGKKK